MIEVNIIILPDGTKKRARVDPSVPLEKTKVDLVKALGIGEPNEYEISISPKLSKQTLQNLRPTQGDLVFLIRKDSISDSSVEILG